MKLYSTDHSPFAARVRMAALYKGLELPEVFPPGGPGSPEFRLITPLGLVPTLALGADTVIPESEVIVEYLEDAYPLPSLRPEHPADRARARLLARIADLYLADPLRELFEHAKGAGEAGGLPRTAARVRSALRMLALHVGTQRHAVGSRPSTADCALVPLLYFTVRCAPVLERADGLLLWDGARALESYWLAIQQDPVAHRVLGEMEASQQRRAQERALHGTNAVR